MLLNQSVILTASCRGLTMANGQCLLTWISALVSFTCWGPVVPSLQPCLPWGWRGAGVWWLPRHCRRHRSSSPSLLVAVRNRVWQFVWNTRVLVWNANPKPEASVLIVVSPEGRGDCLVSQKPPEPTKTFPLQSSGFGFALQQASAVPHPPCSQHWPPR